MSSLRKESGGTGGPLAALRSSGQEWQALGGMGIEAGGLGCEQ